MAETTTTSISGGHETFTGLAARQIRTMVMSGELKAGQKVNEADLAELFEISRGPVREALQQLAAEGLLTIRTHRGAFVRVFDAGEMRDLYGLRLALETFALRASTVRKDQQIATLGTMLMTNRSASQIVESDGYSADTDFHRTIVLFAGNSALLEAHASVMQKITLARSRSASDPVRAKVAVIEHQGIVDALRQKDLDGALRLLELHIDGSLESASALLS